MTEADRDDVIFELHLADTEADRNATLVPLVRVYPDLREDLVDHWCEIVLMELRAAAYPESPCPPVDKDVAARAFAVPGDGSRPRGPLRTPPGPLTRLLRVRY